jgi:hypothetical protein
VILGLLLRNKSNTGVHWARKGATGAPGAFAFLDVFSFIYFLALLDSFVVRKIEDGTTCRSVREALHSLKGEDIM